MREFATGVVRTLAEAGHESYFAGGCVRDRLLGREPEDYDVATAATPKQVRRLFRRTIAVGAAFGVVVVLGPGDVQVEVATFRTDGVYADGRRPESVTFSGAAEDAARRDFTINGMFLDPLTDRLIDHVGGAADLRAGVVRAIGDPERRFAEDRLRMLRAVRFAGRLGFSIEPATAAAVRLHADKLSAVSVERILAEWSRMLVHPRRVRSMELMADHALAPQVCRELLDANGRPLLKHSAALPPTASLPLALAALAAGTTPPAVAAMLRRLKASNELRGQTDWLCRHRDAFAQPLPAAEFRRRCKTLGVRPGFADLIALHAALGTPAETAADYVSSLPPGELDPPPLLTGADLIALGMRPGPRFKRILETLRAEQLAETLTDRAAAMKRLEEL